MALLKDEPLYVFALPFWLLKGKAAFKQEIARRISFDAGLIPYRSELVEYLRTQRAQGRSLVLATGSDERHCPAGGRSSKAFRFSSGQ